MKKKMYLNTALTAFLAISFLAAPVAASAMEVKSSNDKISVNLYGQINRAIMHADDGKESNTFHVDNDNSSTRIGIKAKAKPREDVDLTVGVKFEVEWQSNPSNKVVISDESIPGSFGERHMDLFMQSDKLGKLSLGQGDTASNGASEVDLSGTSLIGYSGVADIGGSFVFYDDNSQSYSSINVGDVFDQMDGLSRKDRVRYDSPKLAGFTLAVSAGEDDISDAAINYGGKFGENKIAATIALANPGKGKDYNRMSGSASILLGMGLNFTLAAGLDSYDNQPSGSDDPSFKYGKLGYKAKFFDIGDTAFSVDYGVYENVDTMTIDQEATAYGLQVVQKLSDWSTELYAGYRIYELDDNTTASYEDISFLTAGARIKF